MQLTPEQEQYELFSKEWESIGFATDNADFPAGKEAVRRLYKYTGDPMPEYGFQLSSPFAGIVAINIYHNDRLRRAIGERVGLIGLSADDYLEHVELFLADVLSDFIRINNGKEPEDTTVADIYDIFKQGKVSVLPASYGSASSYWAAWCLWGQYLGADYKEHTPLLAALTQLCKSVGWVWLFDKSYIMTEKPSEIHVDAQNRIHNSNGAAILWRDGSAIYQVNGVEVSGKVIRGEFTAEDINAEMNAEVRRIMIEKFGAGNYLKTIKAKKVSVDDYGVLYALPNDSDTRIVEVINSTNEFDGTAKIYHLIVPAAMQTAHEAVARSFGLDPEEYSPSVQS